ncbi:MAG TPA: DUF479 domain-containing protein [Cyanobacteria bacterium UBA8803]|nr:DUF479 domain-containing protein [Cyanobacteria bacterium UBA9273]HBL59691.1 DUF479 domain-containing protein [Cyanobacteria bacterium UBA8803]
MNYLAHLYLAEDSPESLIGNLLGDFVKGQGIEGYGDRIQQGILLHKEVDLFTDSHPVVRASKRLISPDHRRYAGILIDVFYDHFLAKNWLNYSSVPLPQFADRVYDILQKHQAILPDSLKRALPHMLQHNLLTSYAKISGIALALQRLSLRLKRPNNLGDAGAELTANYEQLGLNFTQFFPELIDYVKTLQSSLAYHHKP